MSGSECCAACAGSPASLIPPVICAAISIAMLFTIARGDAHRQVKRWLTLVVPPPNPFAPTGNAIPRTVPSKKARTVVRITCAAFRAQRVLRLKGDFLIDPDAHLWRDGPKVTYLAGINFPDRL